LTLKIVLSYNTPLFSKSTFDPSVATVHALDYSKVIFVQLVAVLEHTFWSAEHEPVNLN